MSIDKIVQSITWKFATINFTRMTTLANHIKSLYEAKLYEDVKTLVSIVVPENFWETHLNLNLNLKIFRRYLTIYTGLQQ